MATLFANNAKTTLGTSLSGYDDATWHLTSTTGFPAPGANDDAYFTVYDANTPPTNIAVYKYTGVSGNDLTGVVWQSGVQATWTAGAGSNIGLRTAAEALRKFVQNDGTDGILKLPVQTSTPTAPPSGIAKVDPFDLGGGWVLPAFADGMGSTNREYHHALLTFGRYLRWGLCTPTAGASVAMAVSGTSSAVFGTVTQASAATPALSAGSTRGETYRQTLTGGTGGGSGVGWSASASSTGGLWRGNAAGRGGWWISMRFDAVVLSGAARSWIGLSSLTGSPAGDPSGSGSHILIGADAGDANVTVLTRDGTTTNKAAIGAGLTKANFALPAMYDLTMFAAPNDTKVHVKLDQWANYARTNLFDADVSTNLPASTTFLSPVCQFNCASTGVGQQIALVQYQVLHNL